MGVGVGVGVGGSIHTSAHDYQFSSAAHDMAATVMAGQRLLLSSDVHGDNAVQVEGAVNAIKLNAARSVWRRCGRMCRQKEDGKPVGKRCWK